MSRTDLARQFMTSQRDGNIDAAVAMLADDVVTSNPMQGVTTGKPAVEANMRGRPMGGGGMNVTWSEPEEDGDAVKILGTGGPFGTIKIVISFNGDDQISRIEAGLA